MGKRILKASDLAIGTRVVFPDGADSYPHFIFPEALAGFVVSKDEAMLCVRLDEHKTELDEWENEIQVWIGEGGDIEATLELEPVQTSMLNEAKTALLALHKVRVYAEGVVVDLTTHGSIAACVADTEALIRRLEIWSEASS